MNKKGQLLWFTSFGILLAVGIFFYYYFTVGNIDDFVGAAQLQLLTQAKDAEKAQFYIEQSARFAIVQSVYDLAKDTSKCDHYYGFSKWKDQVDDCIPSDKQVESQFYKILNENLDGYFRSYEKVTIPTNNYVFSIVPNKLKVVGAAVRDLSVSTLTEYRGVRVTKYYVPTENEFMDKWYSGEEPNLEQGYGWCTIPESKRGFYEQVQCQGTGVGEEGEIYKYDTIKPTKQASPTVDEISVAYGGKTAKTHETIAVAPNMIPPLSKVEIKFKGCENIPNNCCDEWEGDYIASDTGSGMRNDWEKGIAHIDLFAGIGREAYEKALSCLPLYADLFIRSDDDVSVKGSTYKIKPNFKTEIDYNLNEYEDLRNELNEIITDVTNGKCIPKLPDTTCVKEVLANDKYDFKWSYNCLPEKERVFYDLIENYEFCDREGVCTIPRPVSKDYEIEFIEENGKIIVKTADLKYETGLTKLGIIPENTELDLTKAIDTASCTRLKFEIDEDNVKLTGECSSGKDSRYIYDAQNIFLYVKDSIGYFLDMSEQITHGSLLPYKPKSNTLKLCAQSTYKNYFYDESDKTTKQRNIVYRIAAFVGDKIDPDPVQGVKITDTPIKEENATVKFKDNREDKDKDVDYYNIYYSEETFVDVESLRPIKTVEDKNTNTYTITIKVDDVLGYFAVTAVDTSGNEDENVNAISANIIDNLNPGPIILEERKIAADTQIEFTIKNPGENTDKSKLNDLEEYFIYKFNPDATNNCPEDPGELRKGEQVVTFSYKQPNQIETIQHPGSEFCYVVVGEDEVSEDIKDSIRYNKDGTVGPV
ncbi:hypothetical protein ACFLZ7_03055 [Nanoarchaeota archaeon]